MYDEMYAAPHTHPHPQATFDYQLPAEAKAARKRFEELQPK